CRGSLAGVWFAGAARRPAGGGGGPRPSQALPAARGGVVASPGAIVTPAAGTPSLSLVLPSGPIAPGAAFDAQVLLASPVATRGAQFGLSFDPRALTVTGGDEDVCYSG